MITKSAQRQTLLTLRRSLATDTVRRASRLIAQNLLDTLDLHSPRQVLIYSALPRSGEVDTTWLVQKIQHDYPSIVIDFADTAQHSALPTTLYDVIVVPVVGFDQDNHRLGHGGGWYDRLLAAQPQALRIGLAYDCTRVDHIIHEPHDIPLDLVVTESHCFRTDPPIFLAKAGGSAGRTLTGPA